MVVCILRSLAGNVTIPFSQEEILHEAIRISELLMATLDENAVRQNSLGIFDHISQIETYIQQIIANTDRYDHLCKHILKQHC